MPDCVISQVVSEPRVISLKQCRMFEVKVFLSLGSAGPPPRLTVCRIWELTNRSAKPLATLVLQNRFLSCQRLVSTLY